MTRTKTTRTQHDSPKKNRLIGIVLGGKSVHHAGKMVGIPASSADRIWKKYTATGSTSNQPRSGRPRSVTDKAKRLIVRTAVKDRRLPFQEIANSILCETRRVVKNNPKHCNGIKLTESVVFWDCVIYHFFHYIKNSTN